MDLFRFFFFFYKIFQTEDEFQKPILRSFVFYQRYDEISRFVRPFVLLLVLNNINYFI